MHSRGCAGLQGRRSGRYRLVPGRNCLYCGYELDWIVMGKVYNAARSEPWLHDNIGRIANARLEAASRAVHTQAVGHR